MGSSWAQFLLQFHTDLFETLQVFLSLSEDVHMVLGIFSHFYFYQHFHFFDLVIRIDILWAQPLTSRLLIHFETMHTCST